MTGSQARVARRTPLPGSAFIRRLAALADVPPSASGDAFAPRLAGWFDWTDAIPLSAALDSPAVRTWQTSLGLRLALAADEREVRRVRASLAKLAQPPVAPAPATGANRLQRAVPAAPVESATDLALHRERYVAAQQAMDVAIVALRERLRATLTAATPALARLAGLDAVMEQVVGAQERVLLSTAPRWLEQRFDQLRRANAAAEAETGTDPLPLPEPDPAWALAFVDEMHALLRAELDFRLQPVDALLEALRSSPDCHE